MEDFLNRLSLKKQRLDSYRPLPKELVKNLDDWFKVELTYTSNAIEGNTLSRSETALIIEKGITVEGKTLREHLEAINHAQAFEFIKTLIRKRRKEITEDNLLEIHRLILSKIDETNAGRYRNVSVRIASSRVTLPNPAKVPKLIKDFIGWFHGKNTDHPVKIVADAHFKLASIHPFIDGNGRCARLLMNLLLIQEGYPPALIKKEERRQYINSIEKAQLEGSLDDCYSVIYQAVNRSFDIYFEALGQKEKEGIKAKRLFKIGELAKITGETVPTLRFWLKEGLLKVKEYTTGGYQLFEPTMVKQAKEIRRLQKDKRLKIVEIKEKLRG